MTRGRPLTTGASPASPAVDPFTVLEIVPTLELGQVKRAYFALLAKHPPHLDPEGFRRLRAAYEAVSHPSGLAFAYARCPPDRQRALEGWQARFGPALERIASARSEGRVVERAIEAYSRLSLAQALSLAGSADPAPRS
jgi:hypothetical protein